MYTDTLVKRLLVIHFYKIYIELIFLKLKNRIYFFFNKIDIEMWDILWNCYAEYNMTIHHNIFIWFYVFYEDKIVKDKTKTEQNYFFFGLNFMLILLF